ncbi:MAG TPA: S41 family peptidase [Longilinea sp.]|nr:S41 family peptidase [Longilinea sp.]
MKSRLSIVLAFLVIASMLLTACGGGETATPTAETPTWGPEPTTITGTFTYSNDFVVETYMREQAVALVDMTGFVNRDDLYVIPIEGQYLGFMSTDFDNNTAAYTISLPMAPLAPLHDVDNDGVEESGVQIFATSYWPNLYGGVYSEGDDRTMGWPNYLASVLTDTENQNEVIGGSLVIWAPDDLQSFPSGFGADGLLLTADDPIMSVPAGYSVINMDTDPFTIVREDAPALSLLEPQDVAIKDYSGMSYTEAFDAMFTFVRTNYAFNGIDGKQPDWDALYAQILPMVQEAEANSDAQAYYMALQTYAWAFNDGHVGLSGGDAGDAVFAEVIGGGYGFAIRELDDGRTIVIYVTPNGPAALAGMEVGAEVTMFNDTPIADAIGAVNAFSGPFSTAQTERYQQARYLLRAPLGSTATVTFTNPGGAEQTVTLETSDERDSFAYTSVYRGYDYTALPVEYQILDSGVGYVKINTNYDDLAMIILLFERALQVFQANEVPGIIIDMRQNSGGANLGLAGFLTDTEIPLGQLQYFSETTGTFENDGPQERVYPNTNQYQFDSMALLVGQACASACEIEAYGFAQVPGMTVVGYYPSSGVEAEVARGQFLLPEGMSMQVPTGRFVTEDGSIFIEGVGIQPDIVVPVTEENALSTEDVELAVAEQAVLLPRGAGVTPTGNPTIASTADAETALLGGTGFLEDFARETYSVGPVPGETQINTVELSQTDQAVWAYGWCAADENTTNQNFEHIQLQFVMNGTPLTADQLATYSYQPDATMFCKLIYVVVSAFPAGQHSLQTIVTFDTTINDGTDDYPAGVMTSQYDVYVAP